MIEIGISQAIQLLMCSEDIHCVLYVSEFIFERGIITSKLIVNCTIISQQRCLLGAIGVCPSVYFDLGYSSVLRVCSSC